ncbi:MAG TPA: tryptophan synthase subunit alpha [Polyangiaceae bacterium]|nr:tryptophan synthase subunit alpha [Polyangiaceae bacterium]
MLEAYLRQKREQQEILLMTHIVLGYPNFDTSLRLVETMVESGVELMELQIPFSEPIADGPVILHANQLALSAGSTVARCFEFASEVARRFPIPFLFMSYYNVLFKHGTSAFVRRMAQANLKGAIVPDLPPEEGREYLTAMAESALDPIFIYSPNTKPERLSSLASHGRGFIYCVARKGVTGSRTAFSDDLGAYLARARAATHLPLAVGFGVKERADVDFLRGKADIAVVGSETLRILDQRGPGAVGPFLKSLR